MMIGVVSSVNVWAPRIGSWLMRWTRRRRRLAVKPICRRAVRLLVLSRLDSPKSRVSLGGQLANQPLRAVHTPDRPAGHGLDPADRSPRTQASHRSMPSGKGAKPG